MSAPLEFPVEIQEIRKHYDRLSILYRLLWGEHLHHGYWENGESASRAQVRLMEQLAEKAVLPRGARVLDIGCGLGGSAFWLESHYHCRVTGFTISPVQARMATRAAKRRGVTARVQFQLVDANVWQPQPESTDVIWIMESSEHFRDKKDFFHRCARALTPGGTLAVCAWLRRDGALRPEDQELVAIIGEAMLSASLDTLTDYRNWMLDAGLHVETAEDITEKIAHTWEHCSRIAERLPVKWLLRFTDDSTRRFVKSFPLMKRAYAQGAMAFGLFVAKKPETRL
jgi:tocopherol O-methyltransferase